MVPRETPKPLPASKNGRMRKGPQSIPVTLLQELHLGLPTELPTGPPNSNEYDLPNQQYKF